MDSGNIGSVSTQTPSNSDLPISIILLGASNLSRGYQGLTHCLAKNLQPHPVTFLSALGPGRGYCGSGGVFNVTYPPIKTCEIFSQFKSKRRDSSRKIALIMDIGNDIMYGASGEEIIWDIKNIHSRLLDIGADTLIVPIASTLMKQLTPLNFVLLKKIFFPRSAVQREEAISAIREINDSIDEGIGERVTVIRGLEKFTGWDKIHYDFFCMTDVWSRIAGEILKALEVEFRETITPAQMIGSYSSHINRMLFSDILGLTKKGPEFF